MTFLAVQSIVELMTWVAIGDSFFTFALLIKIVTISFAFSNVDCSILCNYTKNTDFCVLSDENRGKNRRFLWHA